jgi:head-tail adaptor
MMGPGDLNRWLVLEAPAETDDGEGGVTRLYDIVTTLWAQVTPQATRADVAADSLGAALRFRIVIRARSDVTTRHRFLDGANIYRIVASRESAGGNINAANITSTVTTTTAAELNISGQLANSGETLTLESYPVEVILP